MPVDFQEEEPLDFVEETESKPTSPPSELRPAGVRESLSLGPAGTLFGYGRGMERELGKEYGGATVEPQDILDTAFKFASVPPQAAKPIERITDVPINLLPPTVAGGLQGIRDVALQVPWAAGAVGLGKAGGRFLLGLFTADYLSQIPDAYDQYKELRAQGRNQEAARLLVSELGTGILLGAGVKFDQSIRAGGKVSEAKRNLANDILELDAQVPGVLDSAKGMLQREAPESQRQAAPTPLLTVPPPKREEQAQVAEVPVPTAGASAVRAAGEVPEATAAAATEAGKKAPEIASESAQARAAEVLRKADELVANAGKVLPRASEEVANPEVRTALKQEGLSDQEISDLLAGKASVSEIVERKLRPFDVEYGGGPEHAKALEEARMQAVSRIENALKAQPERIADASRIETPTEIHGDVRPLVASSQGVPVEEGGPRVQPQAERGIPKEGPPPAEVLLKPDEAAAPVKMQSEVSKVAATEGKRSAKEIKEDLIAELQDRLAKAPSEAKPGDKVTIEIPGDGMFTIPNTVEALSLVLERAKKLKTDIKPPGVSKKAIKSSTEALRKSAGVNEAIRQEKLAEEQRIRERDEETKALRANPPWSDYTEGHFVKWLESTVPEEYRLDVERNMRGLVKQDPEVLTNRSWPEIRELSKYYEPPIRPTAQTTSAASAEVPATPPPAGQPAAGAPPAATPPPASGATGRPSSELEMALVPGGRQFIEQDLIPAGKKAATAIGESWRQFRNTLAPVTAGPEAMTAGGIIREHRAELARKDVQAREQFAKAKREMDALSKRASLRFIDDIENGRAQPTADLQSLSAELRQAFNRRVADVHALGTGKLQHVVQDYFPHIWKDPAAAADWYARILGRRPLRGPASFLKHRSIPTTAQGVAAGLEPVSWNPIEISLLKMHEIDRYVMGQKIFQELKDKSLAKFSRSDIPPDGFAKVNDRIANVVEYRPTTTVAGTPGAPERILRGHWYVQEDAARVLNNFLSPGLARYSWYRALRWLGNNLNMAQLGLSGYHFTFTMIDSGTSKLSLGIEQMTQGKPKGILTSARGLAGTVAANQIEYYLKGNKVLQEYTKPGSVGGDYAKIVDGLIAAGGRTEMPRIFKNSSLENFFTAVRGGNYPGAVLRAPFAAIEAVSYPLMQNIVPRLKLGAFSEMALHEIERLGPNVSRAEFRANMGKIWDSIDNRMGELVYDNLFWNRTLKDLSFLAVRAVGWNLGTLRELGGGVVDTAKIIGRLRAGDPVVTKRMAYVVALPMTVGMMGALYQKLRTGQNPEDLRDYYYPKTGQTLPDGTPERVNFPSYLKDIASYSRHPLVTLGHKLHPMWSTVVDMLNNKDFYGTQIRNPDDPLVQQVQQEARFLAGTMVPFSVKGMQRRAGTEGSLETKAESFMGVMPISPEIARSKAQNQMMEYGSRKMPVGPRTQAEHSRAEMRKELEAQLKSPAEYDALKKQLQEARQQHVLTKPQAQYIDSKLKFERQQMQKGLTKSEAQWLWRFKHLSVDEAQHVFEIATPEEKKVFAPELKRKLSKLEY